MALTEITYTGDGSDVTFGPIPFPYLEDSDVLITINGVATTAFTIDPSTKIITFSSAPADGSTIRVYRNTNNDTLAATFISGSAIRAVDLNDNFTQNLYVIQEIDNNAVQTDGSTTMVGDFDMGGYKITNLADPVAGTDAATRTFVEGAFSSQVPYFYRRWSKTAVGGETSLSGTDDNGISLSYVAGSEKVFINGALQVRGVDYTGTTGTTLTGIPALTAGDIVEVHSSSNYLVGTIPDGSVTNAKVDGGAAIQYSKLNLGNSIVNADVNSSAGIVASKLDFTQSGTGATTRTVESKLRDVVSVKDFGAVGDGVTDDTAAIQAALNTTSLEIFIPDGTYRVKALSTTTGTPALTSSVDNRLIHGPGILTASEQVKVLFQVTGDNNTVSINIDGNNNVGYAILVKGSNPTVTNCNIYDLNGFDTFGATAIYLNFADGVTDSSALVSNNTIRNLTAEQGISTLGFCRAILVSADITNYSKTVFVTGNNIEDVNGAEGDAIVVTNGGTTSPKDLPCFISDNVINGWSRRAVKIAANKVTVHSNYFTNNLDASLPSLQRVVDITNGSDITVSANTFNRCNYQGQIALIIDNTQDPANNIIISENTIEGIGDTVSGSLINLVTYGNYCLIQGNKINCPDHTTNAISVNHSANLSVCNNTIHINNASWISASNTTDARYSSNTLHVSAGFDSYYDVAVGEFVFDVSSGSRGLTLKNRDTSLSTGERVASINCRQNDNANPDTVNSSINFYSTGSTGLLEIRFNCGDNTERIIFSTAGNILPAADNTQNLGSAANRWGVVYAGTGTINTSDQRTKQDIESLSDAELRVASALKGLVKKFRFKDAVQAKGDEARIHVGVVVQEVIAAFQIEGLDPMRYGIVCYDQWDAELDDDGNEITPAGDRYGVRYEELLALSLIHI